MDYHAEIHKAGRITIPIELRREMNLAEGDALILRHENGEIRLLTQQQLLDKARSLAAPYLSATSSAVDTFLEWRREQAEGEEAEFQRYDNAPDTGTAS